MRNRLLLVLLALCVSSAWAAGTCPITNVTSTQIASESNRIADAKTVIVTLTCTADASAATFPSTTVPLFTTSGLLNTYNLTGYFLYQVGRTPGGTAPTAGYTVTVTDTQGFALDLGVLTSNGSASAAQLTSISNGVTSYPVVRSAMTVAITGNAVNSAKITLDLIFRATNAVASGGGVNATPALTPTGCTITATGCSTTGAASSVTLANLPAGANHMRIYVNGSMAANAELQMRLNADAGTDYAETFGRIQGTTYAATNSAPSLAQMHVGTFQTSTFNSKAIIDVPFYSQADAGKVASFSSMAFSSISALTNNFYDAGFGYWNQTAAVTSFTLISAGTTFTNGTLISVELFY